MRRPSAFMTCQTLTAFTPTQPTGAPTHGGYVPTWNKVVYSNVRYALTDGAALSAAGKSTADKFFAVFYDGQPELTEGETLLIEGEYSGSTPPDTGFYRVTHMDIHYNPDGTVHNVGVSAS